jgi:hypothetical protein
VKSASASAEGQLTSSPAAVQDTAGLIVVVASSEASEWWDTTCHPRPGTSADPPAPSARAISARSQESLDESSRVGNRDAHIGDDREWDRSGTYLWV